MFILQPEVFAYLDKHEAGADGEIQLTDAIAKTVNDIPFHGLRFDGQRYDCGTKLGFVTANVAFAAACDDLRADIHAKLKDIL